MTKQPLHMLMRKNCKFIILQDSGRIRLRTSRAVRRRPIHDAQWEIVLHDVCQSNTKVLHDQINYFR